MRRDSYLMLQACPILIRDLKGSLIGKSALFSKRAVLKYGFKVRESMRLPLKHAGIAAFKFEESYNGESERTLDL